MIKADDFIGVNSLQALATLINLSGWGNDLSSIEKYDPDELGETIARVQIELGTGVLQALPNLQKTIAALNPLLNTSVPTKGDGTVDINCLPVGLIYWIAESGIERIKASRSTCKNETPTQAPVKP